MFSFKSKKSQKKLRYLAFSLRGLWNLMQLYSYGIFLTQPRHSKRPITSEWPCYYTEHFYTILPFLFIFKEKIEIQKVPCMVLPEQHSQTVVKQGSTAKALETSSALYQLCDSRYISLPLCVSSSFSIRQKTLFPQELWRGLSTEKVKCLARSKPSYAVSKWPELVHHDVFQQRRPSLCWHTGGFACGLTLASEKNAMMPSGFQHSSPTKVKTENYCSFQEIKGIKESRWI